MSKAAFAVEPLYCRKGSSLCLLIMKACGNLWNAVDKIGALRRISGARRNMRIGGITEVAAG